MIISIESFVFPLKLFFRNDFVDLGVFHVVTLLTFLFGLNYCFICNQVIFLPPSVEQLHFKDYVHFYSYIDFIFSFYRQFLNISSPCFYAAYPWFHTTLSKMYHYGKMLYCHPCVLPLKSFLFSLILKDHATPSFAANPWRL